MLGHQRALQRRDTSRLACPAQSGYRSANRLVVRCEVSGRKQRIVFLGTPEVAASALRYLYQASLQQNSQFEIAAVVSQPGKPRGRGNKSKPLPSPVEAIARELGLPDDAIMCPKTAKEDSFLTALERLAPDLCVTAAYGNMLPQAFLSIPRLGTLNIHPSLLPRYRGAAPVQRAVQDGVSETGVSVAYTVLKCDAGPVLAQEKVALDPNIQAPELLALLFEKGAQLLTSHLPAVFNGQGPAMAKPQDESNVLHAAKLTKEESWLDFEQCTAQELHDKVRAFAGWPGTSTHFILEDEATGAREAVEVKISVTAVAPPGTTAEGVQWSTHDTLLLPCRGGTVLEVLKLQPPTKKVMSSKDFKNGIRKKKLYLEVRQPVTAA